MTPPPLLLLHGALGSAEQFEALMPRLPEDRSIWALNLPGHGGLPLPGQLSMPLFAQAILDFLDREAWDEADIFGYSMGGYAALQFALLHPDRVRGIVTLGTKFDWTPDSAAREIALLDPAKIEAKMPQFASELAERHAPTDWKTLVNATAGLLHDLGNGAALTQADFARIEAPVVIMRGELDQMVTEDESRQVAEWLPDGMYEPLEGTKHLWEQVDVDFLSDIMLKFIR
ncbi:MAG: alpha/beta fold hydrolase [Saprospiraceae bacterium]|nr:alpha/beta fold hydrolase [Saprospiraceae bacterium]